MQIRISETAFEAIIKSCKCFVASDTYHPDMQYIKIQAEGDKATAYALNGYRTIRLTVPIVEPVSEPITAYFRPFTFKPTKQGAGIVIITKDNRATTVEVPTEYGALVYRFNLPPNGWLVDADKIYADYDNMDTTIRCDALHLKAAAQALATITDCDRHHTIEIKASEKNRNGFIMKDAGGDMHAEILVLQVRRV